MEIIVAKSSGFCFGVRNAVNGAEHELENNDSEVYCLGELIHNEEIIKSLEKKGLITVDDISDVKNTAIIRAHGVAKDVYEIAKSRNIRLLDFTCPNVLKIHKIAEEYSNSGYFIFLLGIKTHPETIGTISFCGDNSCIIESPDDISLSMKLFENSGCKDLLVISQTTFSVSLFNDIVSEIKSMISHNINLEIKNTICNATSIRQKEAEEIAKNVDMMIIIGGKHSSNTKKLYEVSSRYCKNSLLIQTKDDLENVDLKGFDRIGIVAGASTPQNIIDDVVAFCKNSKFFVKNTCIN